MALKITEGKGFQMVFANGWTISVQFGYGNYGSNYHNKEKPGRVYDSETAEIAAWDAQGVWEKLGEYDDVVGYVSTDEILAIMNRIAAK